MHRFLLNLPLPQKVFVSNENEAKPAFKRGRNVRKDGNIGSPTNLQEANGKVNMFLCGHPQSEPVVNLLSVYNGIHELIQELQTKVTVLKKSPSALKRQTINYNKQVVLERLLSFPVAHGL